MRCCLFTLSFVIGLIALFLHNVEAATPNDPLMLIKDVQFKRSLASGRWGLRPGKRSLVESNVETPVIDELASEVADRLNDRMRRNLATGRWGLRPGKRSAPMQNSDDVYVLIP